MVATKLASEEENMTHTKKKKKKKKESKLDSNTVDDRNARILAGLHM